MEFENRRGSTYSGDPVASVTKLLVSVRDVAEAEAALSGGADVIDVKEPLLGSLGRADPRALREIVDFIASEVPVTAALGELVDAQPSGQTAHALAHLPSELFAAKVGLANLVDSAEGPQSDQEAWVDAWKSRWVTLREENPVPTDESSATKAWRGKRVAVAYADYLTSRSPTPQEVAVYGARLNCEFLLIDTYAKSQPLSSLLTHQRLAAALDECVSTAKLLGLRLVVAGSLRSQELPQILTRWSPDFVAVRGAVCDGDRTARVSQRKVADFQKALTQAQECVSDKSASAIGGDETLTPGKDKSS